VPVPGQNTFVLFGGVNQEPMSGIAELEIREDTCSFELVVPDRIPETQELEGRFAFQGCAYNDKQYFFFGAMVYNQQTKERKCLNEIIEYDFKKKLVKFRYPWHKPERMLLPRRYYSSCLVGSTWVCLGGV